MVRRVFWYRGPDGRGAPLGVWLGLLLLGWLAATSLAGSAPILGFLWWGLLAAVLLPVCLHAARQRDLVQGLSEVRRYEAAFAAFALAIASVGIWSGVLDASHLAETKDHHIMLERARELSHSLLQGHVQYYTHYLQGGDALWDLYPVVPGLVATLLDALLPDRFSFDQCYTFTVVLTWWLRGFAVYTLCRRAAGVGPSVLVTVGALYDVGEGVWDGTWAAAIHWGMVHSNVGISFAGLAIAYCIDALRKPSPAAVWKAAIATTLGLLSHPLAFLYLGVGGACLAAVAWARRMRLRRVLCAFGCLGLGGALSAWYFLPYTVGLSTLGVRFPWPGSTFGELGQGLLTGQRPFGDFGGFYGFALLACCAVLSSRAEAKPSRAVLLRSQALTSLILFCLILAPLTMQAQLFELLPPLRGLQAPRLFMVLKLSLTPVLAWGISRLWCQFRAPGSLRIAPTLVRTGISTMLFFGVGHSLDNGLTSTVNKLTSQTSNTESAESDFGAGVDADLQASMTWIAEQRREDPSPTPFRMVALWGDFDSWPLWWFPWRTGVPLVLPDALPGNFLKFRPQEVSEKSAKSWNVRFLLLRSEDDWPPEYCPLPNSTHRFSAGRYHVFEFDDYDDHYVVAPDAPDAQVSNLSVSGDRIEFDLVDAPTPTPLVVRAAWYPRWQAKIDGTAAPVGSIPAYAGAKNEDQLRLVASNGHVVLTCDGWMPAGRTGATLTGLGLGAGLAFSSARVRRRAARLRGAANRRFQRLLKPCLAWLPRLRWSNKWLVAASTAALLVSVFGFRGWQTHQVRLHGPLGQSAHFTALQLDGTSVPCSESRYSGTFYCTWTGGSGFVINTLGRTPGYTGEFPSLWPGIAVDLPAPGTQLESRFDRIAPGRQLVVSYDTNGIVELLASYNGVFMPVQQLTESLGELVLDLPNANGDGELTLTFHAQQHDVTVVFTAQTR